MIRFYTERPRQSESVMYLVAESAPWRVCSAIFLDPTLKRSLCSKSDVQVHGKAPTKCSFLVGRPWPHLSLADLLSTEIWERATQEPVLSPPPSAPGARPFAHHLSSSPFWEVEHKPRLHLIPSPSLAPSAKGFCSRATVGTKHTRHVTSSAPGDSSHVSLGSPAG